MNLGYRIQAWGLAQLFRAFRLMPLDVSSWIGGVIGQAIGPFFSAHRTARKNIAAAFPQMSRQEQNHLLRGMWTHLGRVAAELSSLPGTRLTSRNQVSGIEHLPAKGTQAIFVSGHIGNWELLSPMAHDHEVATAIIYRHTNNPFVESQIAALRQSHATTLIQKGRRGAVHLIQAMKRGESIAMLVDQKMNNGEPIPFFGRDAMTSTAAAELALKYGIPIIPARIIRTKGAHFKGVVYPPLVIEKTGNHEQDVRKILTDINAMLESWIREYPEQWFWVHKRWPS